MSKLINCKSCNKEVSKNAKTCPHCGEKLKSGFFAKMFKWGGGIILLLIILGIFLPEPDDKKSDMKAQKSETQSVSTDQTGALKEAVAEQEEVVDARPESQKAVLAFIDKARIAAKAAKNDMQKGAALSERTKELCAELPQNKTVKGWIGEIYSISVNGDGKGVLTVTIGDKVWASTWNNALSDIGTNSLIEPGTPVFDAVSALSEGDKIIFSGEFFTDQETCLSTQNMMFDSKLSRPEFVFKFSSVKPAE